MFMPSHTQASYSRGISLLESMVAIVVLVLGVLSMLAMQMHTLADTQTSTRRVQAIRLIEDLGERIRANPHAWDQLERYVSDWQDAAGSSIAASCTARPCSAAELAEHELTQWRLQVKRSLPLGQSRIFLAPGENQAANRRQLGVMIRWRESTHASPDSTSQAQYRNQVDTTRSVGEGSSTNAVEERGGEVVCQDDDGDLRYTCHLQYLALNARCTAERMGGAVHYHCGGA
jgi:type IV pilus assembly protein PilV